MLFEGGNDAKGYTIDNVVPCCTACNRAKWARTVEEFLGWIVQVYEHIAKEETSK